MNVVHYILATAGHVDHGKSSLVRALTGIDPDRLPEEKARGITIDLGFAHFDLAGADATTYRVGIVDVPGHEDFVKNMVAGVGSVDLALLTVAADDGWMPQTEEHLQILTYLGITRGVVALTKIDLAESDKLVTEQVREKLGGSPLADAPIVCTSVTSGRGLEELRSALAGELARTSPQPDIGKPRLAVDRAFTLRGVGTVVTGTLTGGGLRRGQAVVIQPDGAPARVRAVQSYNRDVEQAAPGARVALNLPDIAVGREARGAASVRRGDIVTLPDLGRGHDTIDVLLEMSPRLGRARPLKQATRVRFHHGSANTPASVYFQDGSTLAPGQRVVAQLRFEGPVFAFAGDRFIIRDWPERQTLAGGTVLDPDAPRRGFRGDGRRELFRTRANRPDDAVAFVASEIAREGAADKTSILRKSRLSDGQIAQAVANLLGSGRLTEVGPMVADAAWWEALKQQALITIESAHRAHPEELGLRLTDLRLVLAGQIGRMDVFEALVAALCHSGCVRQGVTIRLGSHRPALPPQLQAAGTRIRSALAAKPLDPPSRKDLAADTASQQALHFLVQTGEAVEIGGELVLQAQTYAQAADAVRRFLLRQGAATVSELKQAVNASRRILVPLLEKLDREGVTLRQGDKRILRRPTSDRAGSLSPRTTPPAAAPRARPRQTPQSSFD